MTMMMMNKKRFETVPAIAAMFTLLPAGGLAFAQSREIPAPPQGQPVVIHSATIHTVSGETIENGHVRFENGVITAVGAGEAPAGTAAARAADGGPMTINANGLHVYPGLIASDTRLGLTETGSVEVTNDHTEFGRISPEVRAAVAVNPDSDHIPVTRANGILTAMTYPSGGLISGRASLMRLDGWTWEAMAIDDAAGLVLNWPRTVARRRPPWMPAAPPSSRNRVKEQLEEIDRLFDEAEAYVAARSADPTTGTDLRFEAMRPALAGEKPILVRASAAGQIETAVHWADSRGYRIIIVGGHDADRMLTLLKTHDVPVIVSGIHRTPSARHDDYDRPFKLPLALHEAGIRFAIASGTGGSAHERNLNHNAATAAAYGLPKETALRAVTLSPAEIFGAGDRLGSIEIGKSATLIVTSGDPLEITTDTLMAFIDGRRIDLGTRQKSLYAKYREKYRQIGLIE